MRKVRPSNTLSAVLLLLTSLAMGCAGQPLITEIDDGGRRLVLLFDASTSMRKNDPDRVALLGGELVMGLAGSRDNVGAITYSDTADVRLPMGPAGDATRRRALRRALEGVERNGITDFARALDRSREMLEAARAPKGSGVILLTDGVPYRGRRREVGGASLGDVINTFRAKGWRVFALALGKEAQTPFLSLLVAKTGGSVFPVTSADELLEAFEDVAVEALGYLRAEREERELEVLPHTGRLAFLGRWPAGRAGRLGAVRHDGAEVSDVIRTPERSASYGVALIENPDPGTWSVEGGDASEQVALIEPSFSLEFLPNQPPERVDARTTIALGVRLHGQPDGIERVRSRLLMRAQLELNEKPRGKRFRLTASRDRPNEYVGTFRAPTVDAESSLRVIVEAVIVESGRPFVLRRSRSLIVQPNAGGELAMRVVPDRLERAVWAGTRPSRVTFTVHGDPDETATVRVGKLELAVSANTTSTLTPPITTRTKKLRFSAVGNGGATWTQTVPFEWTTYTLRGKHRRVRVMPPTPAGLGTGIVPVKLSVVPKGTVVLSSTSLRGPGGARLEIEAVEGGLRARPGKELPPGEYTGRVEVQVAEARSLSPYKLPLKMTVLAPLKLPPVLVLEGSWGWASLPVEVAWPAPTAVPVSISVGDLVGEGTAEGAVIRPDLDIRIVPLDGWKGTHLGTRPRRFALQVFLSSDLPAGDYVGRLSLKPKAGATRPLSIPVRLGIAR